MASTRKTGKPRAAIPVAPHPRLYTDAADSNNIRNWRLFRGFKTHGELAKATRAHDPDKRGISRNVISRLESGGMRWHEVHVTILAATLRCPRSGDLISVNPFDDADIFSVYAGLSDTDRRAALKYAKQLAAK